jgi:GH24 family phage-related lysozyme (muramidase)
MQLMQTPHLKTSIKESEGFSALIYNDNLGFPTIGYGHKLCQVRQKASLDSEIPIPLSEPKADEILTNDIADAAALAGKLWPYLETPSVRADVLIELAFILGGGPKGLPSFRKLIAAVKTNRPTDAAWQIINSKAYTQIPVRLLTLALRYLTRHY